MNDAFSGLVVAAATAVMVAGIFFWAARAKKKRIEALRSLCSRQGWKYRYESGALYHGHRIEGDGWGFETISRSSGRESAPGSSSWGHSSQWISQGEDPGRSTFILGSRLEGLLDFSRMPPQILSRFLGEEITGLRAFSPGERLDSRYILFAKEKPPAMGLLSPRAEELLLAWPAKLPLVVRSSPARLSLMIANKRLEKPEEVDRFIELGGSFLER